MSLEWRSGSSSDPGRHSHSKEVSLSRTEKMKATVGAMKVAKKSWRGEIVFTKFSISTKLHCSHVHTCKEDARECAKDVLKKRTMI